MVVNLYISLLNILSFYWKGYIVFVDCYVIARYSLLRDNVIDWDVIFQVQFIIHFFYLTNILLEIFNPYRRNSIAQ